MWVLRQIFMRVVRNEYEFENTCRRLYAKQRILFRLGGVYPENRNRVIAHKKTGAQFCYKFQVYEWDFKGDED